MTGLAVFCGRTKTIHFILLQRINSTNHLSCQYCSMDGRVGLCPQIWKYESRLYKTNASAVCLAYDTENIKGTGCRRRGRTRKSWTDNVKRWTGQPLLSLLHMADDRCRWATKTMETSAVVPQRRLRVSQSLHFQLPKNFNSQVVSYCLDPCASCRGLSAARKE